MKPATWRAILLTCCAFGALLVVVDFWNQAGIGGQPWYGLLGAYVSGSSEPWHVSIRGIDPGGPADRAAIREGDTVDVRDASVLLRVSLLGQFMANRPVTLRVENAHGSAGRTLIPRTFSMFRFWQYVVWELGCLWLLLFAALIAWRRPYVDNNLLLSTVLVAAAIGSSASLLFSAWPWPWPYVVLSLIGQAEPLSIALWATLASAFARPLSPVRRLVLALTYVAVGVWILFGNGTPDRAPGMASLTGMLTLWFDPTFFIGPAWILTVATGVLIAVACSVLAIVASRGVERQRAGWLLVPCTMLFCTGTLTLFAFHFLSYSSILEAGYANSIITICAPLVLTYAALNRRLIDVGFVLNRTVVFAIVSSIVIGTFILVEWAAGEWLVNANHVTSAVVGMVVALALGLSMRYIHRYVDRFVDNILFRKRHESETALRRFAHEAAYINEPAVLLERTLKTVRDHTTAESSYIVLRNGSAAYSSASEPRAEISENDPAIVELKAWSKPVDLHAVTGSHLHGELAFPMASRGQLVGALVCGPKRDGEAYAPDETEALAALAHGVGSALDVLEAREGQPSGNVMADLAQSVRELSEITRSLPDALAKIVQERAAR
ncbi:MAG TPA: hypothetical protein VGG89_03145 [Candidatus Baltobacteraceae bacterium]|jgi:hypothetical protein